MMPTDFVCPICKCDLVRNTDGLRCTRCHAAFPRLGDDSFDFMPGEQLVNGGTAWRVRQSAMENWYRDFIGDADNAAAALAYEYEPHAAVLGRLRGTILDVGGGVGIARDYIPADAQYLVIDPSLNWLGDAWKGVGRRFPSVNRPPTFIRGVGEYLPFPDSRFDAVLSLWSLNHSSDPERTLNEIPSRSCTTRLLFSDPGRHGADLAGSDRVLHLQEIEEAGAARRMRVRPRAHPCTGEDRHDTPPGRRPQTKRTTLADSARPHLHS